MKKWLSRIIRSRTMNTAHLIVILGAVQSQSELLSRWLTPADLGTLISGIGFVLYYLRSTTTQSLADK